MEHKNEFKRLLEIVKKHNKENDEPHRNEDIAAMLGYSRTHLSDLIGEKGIVTDDHIKYLKLNFPFLDPKEKVERGAEKKPSVLEEEKLTVALIREMMSNTTKLINQNDVAVSSIAKLVDTNALQARMLDKTLAPLADAPKQTPLTEQSILRGIQEALIQVSLGKHYQSRSEAEVAIRSLLVGTPESKKVSIRKSAHK